MNAFDQSEHAVVISEDGRHSIWPSCRPLPWGWREEGFRGPREACLTHIEQVWTDMRPTKGTGA